MGRGVGLQRFPRLNLPTRTRLPPFRPAGNAAGCVCSWKGCRLLRETPGHATGPLVRRPDGPPMHGGVRCLVLQSRGVLLTGGADGRVQGGGTAWVNGCLGGRAATCLARKLPERASIPAPPQVCDQVGRVVGRPRPPAQPHPTAAARPGATHNVCLLGLPNPMLPIHCIPNIYVLHQPTSQAMPPTICEDKETWGMGRGGGTVSCPTRLCGSPCLGGLIVFHVVPPCTRHTKASNPGLKLIARPASPARARVPTRVVPSPRPGSRCPILPLPSFLWNAHNARASDTLPGGPPSPNPPPTQTHATCCPWLSREDSRRWHLSAGATCAALMRLRSVTPRHLRTLLN
jgi:hypothetical protein